MSIPVAVPSSSGKTGTFRKMILVDPADCPSHAAAMPAWETPGRIAGSEPVQPPDAPKRAARLFATEPEAPTTLIPFATSTPARHPIYDLANTPVQHPNWKTPQHGAAEPAEAPRAPKRVQRPASDEDGSLPKRGRALFSDGESLSAEAAHHQNDGGEWPSLDDNAVDMTDTLANLHAERCAAPDIPKKMRTKYTRMLEYLRTFGNEPPISPSVDGELKTARPIRGTSYVDVLRALFVNSRFQVAGLCEAVDALRKAGMSVNLLGSRRAIEMFSLGHTIGQRGGGTNSSSEPTPPGDKPRVLKLFKGL